MSVVKQYRNYTIEAERVRRWTVGIYDRDSNQKVIEVWVDSTMHFNSEDAFASAKYEIDRIVDDELEKQKSLKKNSPEGGMIVLRDIDKEWPGTPKVFYSVYATLADAKQAIEAGATDVLLKPDSTNEQEERDQADRISKLFLQYSGGEPPTFLQRLTKRFGLEIGFGTTQGMFIKLAKKADST